MVTFSLEPSPVKTHLGVQNACFCSSMCDSDALGQNIVFSPHPRKDARRGISLAPHHIIGLNGGQKALDRFLSLRFSYCIRPFFFYFLAPILL